MKKIITIILNAWNIVGMGSVIVLISTLHMLSGSEFFQEFSVAAVTAVVVIGGIIASVKMNPDGSYFGYFWKALYFAPYLWFVMWGAVTLLLLL